MREVLPGAQTPAAQLDVERVGELGPYAADRLAGAAAAQLAALDDDDVVHPGLGQVERDAGAHHAAADDHDVGGRRNGAGRDGGHGQEADPFQRPGAGPEAIRSGACGWGCRVHGEESLIS